MWSRLVVLAALCGCHDPEVDALDGIKDRVCACHTAECADLAVKDVARHDVASNRKTQRIAREMLACVARAHDEELPADDEPTNRSGSAGSATAP